MKYAWIAIALALTGCAAHSNPTQLVMSKNMRPWIPCDPDSCGKSPW